MFEKDFYFWNEEHFKTLPNVVISKIRNMLIQESVPIERRPGLSISTALERYITEDRGKAPDKTQRIQNENTKWRGKDLLSGTLPSDTKGSGPYVSPFKPVSFEGSFKTGQSRPGDVLKLYPSEMKYSRKRIEPIRRRYEMFLNTCRLCGASQDDGSVMFPLFQISFLKGQALRHFMDTVLYEAAFPEAAINMLEEYFLDDREKHVSDEIWMELNLI